MSEIADLQAQLASLAVNFAALERRIRRTEDSIEVIWTPWWKRLLFALDGWPYYRLAERRARRPWHAD